MLMIPSGEHTYTNKKLSLQIADVRSPNDPNDCRISHFNMGHLSELNKAIPCPGNCFQETFHGTNAWELCETTTKNIKQSHKFSGSHVFFYWISNLS